MIIHLHHYCYHSIYNIYYYISIFVLEEIHVDYTSF